MAQWRYDQPNLTSLSFLTVYRLGDGVVLIRAQYSSINLYCTNVADGKIGRYRRRVE